MTTRLKVIVAVIGLALFVAGATGVLEYVRTYQLFRGFAPPHTPAAVVRRQSGHLERVKVQQGSEVVIRVHSRAIGDRSEPVYVFLPPGYFEQPRRRYPVFYALHGTPGVPIDLVDIVDMGVTENVLVAEHEIRPMIIVSPTGALSPLADDEWANGVRPRTGWDTYLAQDVVRTIDRRFRTIAKGADRAIAGLSEGGYGALNIAIQNPGEFRVVESWSGYMLADRVPAVWGSHPSAALLAYNSPLLRVGAVAGELRKDHAYFWFYCGSDDPLAGQNQRFARVLGSLLIPYSFQLRRGGHNWKLWREMVNGALIAASEHFG